MIKHVYNHAGDKLLRREEATPECGEDFCDRCGDCLYCDGGESCLPGTDQEADNHFWVEYQVVAPETETPR